MIKKYRIILITIAASAIGVVGYYGLMQTETIRVVKVYDQDKISTKKVVEIGDIDKVIADELLTVVDRNYLGNYNRIVESDGKYYLMADLQGNQGDRTAKFYGFDKVNDVWRLIDLNRRIATY